VLQLIWMLHSNLGVASKWFCRVADSICCNEKVTAVLVCMPTRVTAWKVYDNRWLKSSIDPVYSYIDFIHIWPFFPVHFDAHKAVIQQLCSSIIFKAFSLHHMTPACKVLSHAKHGTALKTLAKRAARVELSSYR